MPGVSLGVVPKPELFEISKPIGIADILHYYQSAIMQKYSIRERKIWDRVHCAAKV